MFLRSLERRTGLVSFLYSLDCGVFGSVRDPLEAVDVVFRGGRPFSFIRPFQVREEIEELIRILSGLRPGTVLEIGTASGGTLFLWTRVSRPDSTIISIDLPGGLFGGGYPYLKKFLYRCFRCCDQRIVLLRGDSHDPGTLREIREIIGDEGIVFLFIDGDHRYEGVKRDYEMYSPLVRPGGIIAFHDIVPGSEENVGGVPRFWEELKKKLPGNQVKEIVKDWGQGGYGIGIIFK